MAEYVGVIRVSADGVEIPMVDLKEGAKALRKMVKTSKGTGTVELVPDNELSISVVIDKIEDEPNWRAMKSGVITHYPKDGGGRQVTYHGCAVTDVEDTYTLDKEAVRDLTVAFAARTEK